MQVGFEIADYDQTKPLIIDPVLAFSATFGGSGLNQGLGVAVDGQDNVYVTGITTSGDFPTVNPYQTNKLSSYSAYVVKFDTNGAVVYSTFLGGGVLNDQTTTSTSGQGIAVDANGDAFVTGYTTATNFPTKNPLQSKKGALSYSGRNAFVTELNPDGNALIYSTYLGGSNSERPPASRSTRMTTPLSPVTPPQRTFQPPMPRNPFMAATATLSSPS